LISSTRYSASSRDTRQKKEEERRKKEYVSMVKKNDDADDTRDRERERERERDRERDASAHTARQTLAETQRAARQAETEAIQHQIAVEAQEAEEDPKRRKVHLHEGQGAPTEGVGLKPGDWHAPASNPGAAARVPDQPLQPESMQSHGKGILFDKDLSNPPYDTGDPLATDASPAGSRSPSNTGVGGGVDKETERKRLDSPARAKELDPDNPTQDATASPNPAGTTHSSHANRPGGSNPGSAPASKRR
jgi:hypothetical protein